MSTISSSALLSDGLIDPASLPPPITPEQLLGVPNSVNYELVDGRLVERNMGLESSGIAARILILIGMFLRDHPLGFLFGPDAGYQCFPDAPAKVRKPDVSFIRFGRLKDDRVPAGHCPVPPDLAVEVISPGDLAYEVEHKVSEYLTAGVPLVWVVHPLTRTVRVHRGRPSPLGNVSHLVESDLIRGEDAVPGFECRVAEFFATAHAPKP
jgi:Uma2 family endonuclease